MPTVDLQAYGRYKNVFLRALATVSRPGSEKTQVVESVLAALRRSGYTSAEAGELLPYLQHFVDELFAGTVKPLQTEGFLPGFATESPQHFATPQAAPPAPPTRAESEKALIEQLIAATRLYDSSGAIDELLQFTSRLRVFAPFNAMLLHIQKPGLTHAATAGDWWGRFRRVPKTGARPLLILRTMGPIDFVFDIMDTEGGEVPVDAFSFPTFGDLSEARFQEFMAAVSKERIELHELDAGDGTAGWIQLTEMSTAKNGKHRYKLAYNRNHSAPTRFVTVAHELAHLYLGHLGEDRGRRVPDGRKTPHALREVEAEMVAYLVAKRNGLKPRSESYLATYRGALESLNLHAVMRAANAVETTLGIPAHEFWARPATS